MDSQRLLKTVALVGREHPSPPPLQKVEIFAPYFDQASGLPTGLERRDGACTRREILLRYLLLNAVLDQGPDTEGVRRLLTDVTNALYRQEVRFLHKPEVFFQELGIAVDQISSVHGMVKNLRATQWAAANQSQVSKYSLFLDGAQQVLNYAVFRWGSPLAVPLLLTKDEVAEEHRPESLFRYVTGWRSAEIMSKHLKTHPRYGLGKAVGDKATHLFAKWLIHTFPLVESDDPGWGPFGFEVPFDSNAGRVLFRTGFFLQWASLEEYKKWDVVRPGKGKKGAHYLRVTNVRNKSSGRAKSDSLLFETYCELYAKHLKIGRGAPRTFPVQRIPLALLLNTGYTPGELDDGLMYIGTQYCFNHADPLCADCPVHAHCLGHAGNRSLITDYRT
ncbi:MAG: hypothetical protein ACUVXG_07945 [Anaerolineae bacterium]